MLYAVDILLWVTAGILGYFFFPSHVRTHLGYELEYKLENTEDKIRIKVSVALPYCKEIHESVLVSFFLLLRQNA